MSFYIIILIYKKKKLDQRHNNNSIYQKLAVQFCPFPIIGEGQGPHTRLVVDSFAN